MRITIVAPRPGLSGGIRVLAIYAEYLRQHGHDVTLVYPPFKKQSIYKHLRSCFREKKWQNKFNTTNSHFEKLKVKHYAAKNLGQITNDDVPSADVVIATWWETTSWVSAFSEDKGVKVYFVQDYGGSNQPLEEIRQTWKLPMHIITISEWLYKLILSYGQVEVSLVPNAVDSDIFDAGERSKPKVPTVGFVYSPLEQKGSDICIEAINNARKTIPDLKVVFFSGRKPHDLKQLLPPNTDFHFRVPDSELKNIYGSCTVWLFGSRREGFGLPILESMACRTPVIATPAGAAEQLLANGGGVLVDHDDPESMSRQIINICNMTESKWKEMSDTAYLNAHKYTWDDATNLFVNALERAIERKKNEELS